MINLPNRGGQVEQLDAVLRRLGLDKYIANENVPGVAKEGQPTEEIEAQREWREGDARDAPESNGC